MAVKWASDGGILSSNDLYEVQVGLEGAPSFMTITAKTTSATIEDLWPGTAYTLWLRKRSCFLGIKVSCKWSSLSAPSSCTTAALAPGQLHILPPKGNATGGLSLHEITVRIAAESLQPSAGAPLLVQVRPQGSSSWGETYTVRNTNSTTIKHLKPATAYEVRASQASGSPPSAGVWSDIVVHRTKDPRVEMLDLYREAEGCGDHCVAPDYLYNHDAGDVASDMWFITNSERARHCLAPERCAAARAAACAALPLT